MRSCLIGYSGFVGNKIGLKRNILKINSKNILSIKNKNFNYIYCAAPSGKKYIANQNPNKDFKNILDLIKVLKTIKCKKFILISTIDVYQKKTVNVNEKYSPKIRAKNYGSNRLYLEKFVIKYFNNTHIIRLPNLFGTGLTKNFIFDLIHHDYVYLNKNSIVQLFNIDKINFYIKKIILYKIKCINLISAPLKVKELCKLLKKNRKKFIGVKYQYNIQSIYSGKFTKNSKYIISKNEIKKDFLQFYLKNF